MLNERMETMEYCFGRLNSRIISVIKDTDLNEVFEKLRGLDEPTIVTGVGGSSVVSAFFSKVIENKNHVICTDMMPRDLLYRDLKGYRNVVACSYSGNNIGVRASFENDLNHYLFSANKKDGINSIQYVVSDPEVSFISVAGTMMPLAVLFLYYTDNNVELLKEILASDAEFNIDPDNMVYEIMFGYENLVSARLLESTITEGALGVPLLHDKYNYCHGRYQLNVIQKNDLIYFVRDTALDELYLKELKECYDRIICIPQKYQDPIIADFHTAILCFKLLKKIAESKETDFCRKDVPDHGQMFYTFKGKM